jgi:hypothetical protein
LISNPCHRPGRILAAALAVIALLAMLRADSDAADRHA